MTRLANLTRRFRAGLRRFLWSWAWRPPKDPPHIAAMKAEIAARRKQHRPVKSIQRELMAARHERMRRIYG